MTGKPSLRVTKWIQTVPVAAYCTNCGREFRVPMTAIHRAAEARKSLQLQFTKHRRQSRKVETPARGRLRGTKNEEGWKELRRQAQMETDSDKLLAIVEEINQLVEEEFRSLPRPNGRP